MIRPVNDHLIIEPIKHESFISSQQETYQEIGRVIATPWENTSGVSGVTVTTSWGGPDKAKVGDKVYFDAWLAAKFPGEKPDEFLWLVRWEDVRAIERDETVSK